MSSYAASLVRRELELMRASCQTYDALPELNRRFVAEAQAWRLADAISGASSADDAAECRNLLDAARESTPSAGQQLWRAALDAGYAVLPALAPAGVEPTPHVMPAPVPPATPPPPPAMTPPSPPPPFPPPPFPPPPFPPPSWAAQPYGGAPVERLAPGRVFVAQLLLWGGLLLAAYLTAKVSWFAVYGGYHGDVGGLHLGLGSGRRAAALAIELAPYVLAAAIAATSAARWLVGLCAALLAGAIDYVFWFSGSSAAWVMAVTTVVVLFAGWLGLRGRPPAAYALALPAAALAVLYYVPDNPGLWIRLVPVRARWTSLPAYSTWGLIAFIAAGLIGLIAAAVARGSRTRSAGVGAIAIGGLAVIATLAGVVVQTAYVPHSPQPPVAATYQVPDDQPTEYNQYSEPASILAQSDVIDTADEAFQAMAGSGYVNTCDGDLPSLGVADYTLDEVSPETDGTFYVSADVTLDDGSTETVSYLVGTDNYDEPCVEAPSVQVTNTSSLPVASPAQPEDVPSIPSAGDPVPHDAALPGSPDGAVLPYTDAADIPRSVDAFVEWRPGGLDAAENAAVQDVIAFMAYINQQRFQAAWAMSTGALSRRHVTAAFERGYATSRFYQVAFGQPQQLAEDLIIIPARFVSRQNPAAEGNPAGVTGCTYWPQYVFVVARSGGRWRDDVAGAYAKRPELRAHMRESANGDRYLNPIAQRVSC